MNFDMIRSVDELQQLIDTLMAKPADTTYYGFDIETGYHGPDRDKGSLYIDWDAQFTSGFSLTSGLDWARYVPVAHDIGSNLPEGETWEIMKPFLENRNIVAHNLQFETKNMRALGWKKRGPRIDILAGGDNHDSMLESYVLSMNQSHGLKSLVKEIFGYAQAEISSLFPDMLKKEEKSLRFNVLELTPEVISYACDDAVQTLRLHEYFWAYLLQDQKRMAIYSDMEMPILRTLCDKSEVGHAVDWDGIREAYAQAGPFLEKMQDSARVGLGLLGGDKDRYLSLNFNSPLQVRKTLYTELGMTTTRLTNSGEMSTDEQALTGLAKQHKPVRKLLESRQVKNLSNRLKKWLNEYSDSHDGRVHPTFNQHIVGSGRYSADSPAVQQLPAAWFWTRLLNADSANDEHQAFLVQHESAQQGDAYWKGNFKNFMIAEEGHYLSPMDYSQAELRALAGLSQEQYLIDAFENGIDMHSATASLMLGIPLDQITKKTRGIGKTLNFALLYQMGLGSLAERLAVSYDEASRLYDDYMRAFPRVRDWIENEKVKAYQNGYIETYFGRKFTLWDITSSNPAARKGAERLAVNAPVQGFVADLVKIATLRVRKALEDEGLWMTKVRMVNNIHDALVFEVNNEIHPDDFRTLLQPQVSWPIEGFPEFKVDWELGTRWGGWKEILNTDEACSREWLPGNDRVTLLDGSWRVTDTEEREEAPKAVEAAPEAAEKGREFVQVWHMETFPRREDFSEFLDSLRAAPGSQRVRISVAGHGQKDLDLTTGRSLHDADWRMKFCYLLGATAQEEAIYEGALL